MPSGRGCSSPPWPSPVPSALGVIRPDRFLVYAAAGAFLWAGAWMTLGYVCADVIALIVTRTARFGPPLLIAITATLIAYLAVKYVGRRRFLRHLRQARITPVELKRRMEAGDHLVIVDVRTPLDVEAASYRLPGARWLTPEALDSPHQLLPSNSEVVFYCAEPREATSARMARL